MINYYKLLGVDNLATHKELARAGKDKKFEIQELEASGISKTECKRKRAEIDEALEILLDADEREAYDTELDNAPIETVIDPTRPRFFDYSAIRQSAKVSWKEAIGWNGSVDVNLYSKLLRMSVKLPHQEIQENILLAGILTPMPLADMLPIIFCHGASGSGKSNIGKFAYTIYGNRPVTGATTYSAIKRKIDGMSRAIDQGRTIDLPHALVWDDISLPVMKSSPAMYSVIKSGYDRETAVIEMADRDSDNGVVKFHCFGLRVFSSVYPYYADVDFCEMTRRMLVIETRKSPDADDLISFPNTDWTGLKEVTNSLWENPQNHGKYFEYKRQVLAYARNEKPLPAERSALCADLLTTGLTLGIWNTVNQAYEQLREFYASTDELARCKASIVARVIAKFIETQEKEHKIKKRDYKIFIRPLEISDLIKQNQAQQVIDRSLRYGELHGIMSDLGWELTGTGSNAVWAKI